MILVHILIGFTLVSSTFFTSLGIIRIIGGLFGYYIDLDWPILEKEYWAEKRLKKIVKKHTKHSMEEEEKALKCEAKALVSNKSGNKFDIAIDDPCVIIRPTADPNGADLDSLISEGANIELNELNARLQMLGAD